ncbi:MAG: hypothetical protein A2Y38_17085 [Spirochaetes bacterium GWB1_59_5]|nr:MAG: hypothetical protein A2Y38_17085 [Spirochaetes bacterium GWB1_59_5]
MPVDSEETPKMDDGTRIKFMRRMLQVRAELRDLAILPHRSPDYRKAMKDAIAELEEGLQDMGLVLK